LWCDTYFSEHFVVLVDLELQSSVSIKIYKISMFKNGGSVEFNIFELNVSEGTTTSGWDFTSNNFYTSSQLTPKESFSWRK